MDADSDAAVIAASLEEPARFGEIFDRHATVLYRYLVRRLGPDEAEAMVGDTFRIAFERRHTYDVHRPLARPWLYGIATNLVAKHRRGEARRLRAVARLAADRVAAADFTDHITGELDAADVWPLVVDAVTNLPEPERDALVLHVWEGLSYEDVAHALDVPIGTVRSRLHRARERLRGLPVGYGREDIEPTRCGDPGKIRS